MTKPQTLRERVLNTFSRKKTDRIVFSPRLYYWYYGNRLWRRPRTDSSSGGTIPKQILRKSLLGIFDYLEASPRYVTENFLLPIIWPWKQRRYVRVRWSKDRDGTIITAYKTKFGNLYQKSRGGHLVEYPVKTVNDMNILKYIIEKSKFHFSLPVFNIANKLIGDRGVVSTFYARSPLMSLIIEYMGFERTIINLRRYPNEMEDLMNFIDIKQDDMYETLCKSPIKILNFGENIDCNLTPPKYFEKYLIPYYEKRVKQFHREGKYCHIHMDGSLRDLLPYLEGLPFDGLEALTAKPQGDVTLRELQKSIGNKILLDGIPSILFLPQYSSKYVKEYAYKVLEMFSPNLILGISDELPPNADFRKLEIIADIVKKFVPS